MITLIRLELTGWGNMGTVVSGLLITLIKFELTGYTGKLVLYKIIGTFEAVAGYAVVTGDNDNEIGTVYSPVLLGPFEIICAQCSAITGLHQYVFHEMKFRVV